MKKTLTIFGIVILALIIAIVGVYFFAFSDKVEPATLVVTNGLVEVNYGLGFRSVTGVVSLSKDDIVRTSNGARAAIILFESSVTLLEPNTQVTLTSLSDVSPLITQNAGITFTRFASLTSMKTLFIKMPVGTISASGASYRINMDGVRVYSGFVTHKSLDGIENHVNANMAMVLDYGQWNMRTSTTTEKAIMRENALEAATALKVVRNNLVFKNKKLLSIAEKKHGVSATMILDLLSQADVGKYSTQDLTSRIPVNLPVMARVFALTEIIAQENQNYYAPLS